MGRIIENEPEIIKEIQEEHGLAPLVRPGFGGGAVVLASENSKGDKRFGVIPVIKRKSSPTELALARRVNEPLISSEDQGKAIEGVRQIVEERNQSTSKAIVSFFETLIRIVQNPPYEERVVDTTKYKGSLAGLRIVETTREITDRPVLPREAGLTIKEEPAEIKVGKRVILGDVRETRYPDGTVVTAIRAPLQHERQVVSYQSSTNGHKGTDKEATGYRDATYGPAGLVEEEFTVNSGLQAITMSFEYD